MAAFHRDGRHKLISVTDLDDAGRDYPCDDSDGPDKSKACQIQCTATPCMEPYRLCLAHAECSAIAVNKDHSFATLKAELYRPVAAVAHSCSSLDEWKAWFSNRTKANLPAGSYLSSCTGCSVEGGILTCTSCGRTDGSSLAASVPVGGCSSFENNNGVITCLDSVHK